ncbi:glycosyltransferase family 4 protein [Candidatus Uhrbacteria bacterium]|nr:glycosyltransferase family 4 protein [Candidatus Uhrbacteria bacterium]
MRIHIIGSKGIPSSSVPGAGGIERHVEQLAKGLSEKGNRVFVYTRSHSEYDKLTWNGVRLIRLPSIRTKNLEAISHTFLSTLHVLFQDTDIIHYHGVGPSTLAWIPRLFKRKAKTVCTFHNRDWFDSKWSKPAKLYLRFGEWCAVRFPHATIAVSHTIQVFCRTKFKKEVHYIPNGADMPGPQGTSELAAFGLEPNNYLLGVGRLLPRKAYDIAIEAYRRVPGDMPLVIVGEATHEGDYAEKLHALAAKDPRVRLLGYQSGQALKQLFAHCYAFVHPSQAEGLSVSIIEAMASAKVVIMSNIEENLELVDHSGLAFETDNIDALRKAYELVLSDPEMVEQRGKRAREVARREYSWSRVIDKTDALFKDLIQT